MFRLYKYTTWDILSFSTKVYPLAPVERKQLDDFLKDNLKSRCICLSKLPMASLVFFIKKEDGSLGLIQDYWKLNMMMVKNAYPLSLIPNILNMVFEAKAKYFTKLNVWWGYNNIKIKEGDEWKAAFQTNLLPPLTIQPSHGPSHCSQMAWLCWESPQIVSPKATTQ